MGQQLTVPEDVEPALDVLSTISGRDPCGICQFITYSVAKRLSSFSFS